MVIAVVDDLMFGSRIRAVAAQTGRPVRFVKDAPQIVPAVRDDGATMVIVDLDRSTSFDPMMIIRAVKTVTPPPRVVAYGSHVRADLMAAAKEAGADVVLARSAFVTQLPSLLAPVEAAS